MDQIPLSRRHMIGGLLLTALALPVRAESPGMSTVGGFALGGFDPVSYRDPSGPVRGNPATALRWKGAKWCFASEQHRAEFEANPRWYAPRYHGYCAWSLAYGDLRPGDPGFWALHDDSLFLAQDKRAMDLWKKEPARHIAAADVIWHRVRAG